MCEGAAQRGAVPQGHAWWRWPALPIASRSSNSSVNYLNQTPISQPPCRGAGTGVLAKRADLRWRRTADQITQLSTLQDDLLNAASAFVKPGGLLVYSTCSIEVDECSDRVRAFLGRPEGGEFDLEAPPPGLMPEGVVGPDGCVATLPHQHGVDGAFAARLRRRGAAGA
jgi:16S rRNA (cytosine967-C5)-methyltransferase